MYKKTPYMVSNYYMPTHPCGCILYFHKESGLSLKSSSKIASFLRPISL